MPHDHTLNTENQSADQRGPDSAAAAEPGASRPLRVGIGGPVGTGKTALVAALCATLGDTCSLAVVTNDIFTREDAESLRRQGVLPGERIRAVETGCCPHTAIRDDIAANLDAVETLERDFADLDLVLVESGGDNLTAMFSNALVDVQIFVLDVAGGDTLPRKGGPGITKSDLLVINKTDLAPLVGADLDMMEGDAHAIRGARPTVLMSLAEDPAAGAVADWVGERLASDTTASDGGAATTENLAGQSASGASVPGRVSGSA